MNYKSNHKVFKEWELTKSIVYNLAVSLFITLVILVLGIKLSNARLDEVLSDSMVPVFSQKDIVLVVPQKSYKINDIIEYKKGSTNVTHRIVSYDPATGIYKAKGDNTSVENDDTDIKINMINGKVVGIWHNGRSIYHLFKDNYFLVLTIVVGLWVFSSTINNESEMRKHNILGV